MTKLPFILFGFFVLIFIIWTLNIWQSGNWKENLLQNALPKLKVIDPGESPGFHPSTSSDYKEFASSDGKLKIKYPASWLAVENQGLFAAAAPKEWQEKYSLATLFLAQYFKADKFAQLILQEGVFDMPIEAIIEKMKENNKKQELSMEIIQSDIQDDKVIFEARYLIANSPNLYSKEEILLVGEKTYLIAFVTLEKDWPEFSEEANVLLNSAQVVQ